MMKSEFEESTKPESSSSTQELNNNNNNNNNDAGDFECNICFELAQDPIVTLCGHLYCWPCLYRWLRYHSQSHECPVCKALVQEHKLVPLYGRGKSNTDPRSRPVPGVDIPNRPSGQRPDTAPPPPPGAGQGYFSNFGFGLFGGFMPMATARIGNMTMSAGFAGFFPSMGLQINGFPNNPMYGTGTGTAHGFPFGYHQTLHGFRHSHDHQHQHYNNNVARNALLENVAKYFLIIGFIVLYVLFL